MRAKLALLLLLSLMLGVSCQISPSPTQGEYSATDKMSAILDHLLALRRQVDLLSGMPSTLSTVLNRLSDIENGLTELKAGQTLMKEKMKEVVNTSQAHCAMIAHNQNCCKLHTVESSMTALTSKVDTLAIKMDTLTSATDYLNNTVVLQASDTKTLSSEICDLGSKADNLTRIIKTHDSQTSILNAKISSLDSRVDSLINTTDSILLHTGTLTSKVDVLDSSVKVFNNTITPLPTQVNILTSTMEGVKLGQSALHLVTEEVKGNLSLLRERVEELHNSLDTQANTITDLATSEKSTTEGACNKTVELLEAMIDSQKQHLSRMPYIMLTSLSSCQQLAEDYPSAPSGYYWVENHDGCSVSSYCIINSQPNPANSCQQLAQDHPQGDSGYYWVKDQTNNTVRSYCIITSLINPASSCQQLAQDHSQGASGYYWVRDGTGQPIKVYCDMTKHCCNSTGGWVRVAYVNMTDPSQQCPSGLRLRTDGGVRSCGISKRGCTSTTFPSHGIEYIRVCGIIRAYQYWQVFAFDRYHAFRHYTINDQYVDGVSLTHGSNPRTHIWTFAAAYSEFHGDGNWGCPCARTNYPYSGAVPPFIGQDYFCDTAVNATERYPSPKLYTNDPLWDGQGCGPTSSCCSFNSPPWFCKQLPQSTTDDIELRVCVWIDDVAATPFDQVELYIQ